MDPAEGSSIDGFIKPLTRFSKTYIKPIGSSAIVSRPDHG
jgi:hypothetical protein